MVKTGSERAKKFAEKHEPNTIMLRIKRQQESMKQKFQIPATQDYFIDKNVLDWIEALDLPFGKAGALMDLTKNYVWKIADMNSTDIEVMHLAFISKGFTEEQYELWLPLLYAKQIEITTQYSFCHLNPSRIRSLIEFPEPHNKILTLENQLDLADVQNTNLTLENQINSLDTHNTSPTLETDVVWSV